tara:strand:- start:18023 stop:18958 length:936 start_codon:yes stop_codon:yes gene_type:complete
VKNTVEDEIDLKELIEAILSGKWVIILVTLSLMVAAYFYAKSIPDQYTSTAVLTSAAGSASQSSFSGQLGGIASLAGVNLSGANGGKTVVALELMKSWGFLEEFIRENKIDVQVYAAKGWDRNNNQLIIDESIYDVKSESWLVSSKDVVSGVNLEGPSSWALFEKIKNRIKVTQDINTGFIYVSVEHFSPYVAKTWIDLLVSSINKKIQLRERKDALESIEYLKMQIGKTNIAEMKTVFYQLIEEQVKKLMLADISNEYVFKTLAPARVSEVKSKPKRSLIIVLVGFIGLILSIVLVLIVHFVAKTNKSIA